MALKSREAPQQAPHSNELVSPSTIPSLARSTVVDIAGWRARRGVHDWPADPCSGPCMCWGTADGWWNDREVWSWFVAEGRWSA
jgi:hypothetical protein